MLIGGEKAALVPPPVSRPPRQHPVSPLTIRQNRGMGMTCFYCSAMTKTSVWVFEMRSARVLHGPSIRVLSKEGPFKTRYDTFIFEEILTDDRVLATA